jgi:hypothetical protein
VEAVGGNGAAEAEAEAEGVAEVVEAEEAKEVDGQGIIGMVSRDLEETEGTMKLKKWEYSPITRFLSQWKGAAMGSWTLFTSVF